MKIPPDEEIERIAMRMHKIGKPCLETIYGCNVFYRPWFENSYSLTSVNPFTGEQGKKSPPIKTVIPTEFTFGYNAPSRIVLVWKAGDDKPPEWFRYEANVLQKPKLEYMEDQQLCELVQATPPGVKLHTWKPRANHRCAGGSHWHAKVKLSERPYYLELYWRQSDVSPIQPQSLGVFRLDLNGLLRGGYIRLDNSNRKAADCVRLRFFRSETGDVYIQTKQDKPQLQIVAGSPAPKETQKPPTDLPEPPARCKAQVSRIIRDTPLARDLKSLYSFTCQVRGCDFRVEPTPNSFYIEVHHIRPLGGGHAGLDIHANMLVLCPNHHAMFDYRIPRFLSTKCIEIEGVKHDLIIKHELSPDSVEYHNTKLQNRNI